MSELINAVNLGFRPGNRYILHDISWQVHAGEHWVLFGLNGSGKTTLLSILSAYQANTHGELQLFATSPDQDNVLSLRPQIGFVSSSFFDHYYTREIALNIVLSGKYGVLGVQEEISDSDIIKAKSLLRALGLEQKMHYPYHLLSKGQRQCVLIARALFNQPQLLLLDEPFSGLDILTACYLRETIEYLCQEQNLAIIYVTHSLDEIMPQFDRCLLLHQGKIAACDKTEKIFTDALLSKILQKPIHISHTDGKYSLHTSQPSALLNWYEKFSDC